MTLREKSRISVFSALLSLSFASPLLAAEKISIRADIWCPFNCAPDSAAPGYMIEIAQAAFANTSIKIDYAALNWARAIEETRQGLHTAIVGAANGDAPDFIFPDTELGMSGSCYFTSEKSKWKFEGVSSLSSITLGVIKDYSYSPSLDEYIKKNSNNPKAVDTVSGDDPLDINMKKLQSQRIQAFVEDRNVIYNRALTNKEFSSLKEVGCEPGNKLYIAFSPKIPKAKEYAGILSAQVIKMRKDGSLSKLLKNYGLTDWQPTIARRK